MDHIAKRVNSFTLQYAADHQMRQMASAWIKPRLSITRGAELLKMNLLKWLLNGIAAVITPQKPIDKMKITTKDIETIICELVPLISQEDAREIATKHCLAIETIMKRNLKETINELLFLKGKK